jgi:hypothetical protein
VRIISNKPIAMGNLEDFQHDYRGLLARGKERCAIDEINHLSLSAKIAVKRAGRLTGCAAMYHPLAARLAVIFSRCRHQPFVAECRHYENSN